MFLYFHNSYDTASNVLAPSTHCKWWFMECTNAKTGQVEEIRMNTPEKGAFRILQFYPDARQEVKNEDTHTSHVLKCKVNLDGRTYLNISYGNSSELYKTFRVGLGGLKNQTCVVDEQGFGVQYKRTLKYADFEIHYNVDFLQKQYRDQVRKAKLDNLQAHLSYANSLIKREEDELVNIEDSFDNRFNNKLQNLNFSK